MKCLFYEKFFFFNRFHVLLRVMNIPLENQSSSLGPRREREKSVVYVHKDTFSGAKSVLASNDLLKDLTRESN